MFKKVYLIIAVFITASILLLLTDKIVFTQAIGLKISPVRVEELVDPGQVLEKNISITNESDVEKLLYVYIRDFRAAGETGSARLFAPGTQTGHSLAAWLDITSEGIMLGPRETREINYSIKIPANAGPGGYYGAIHFGTVPPKKLNLESEEKGAGMAIGQQAGSLILLQVKGDVDEEARIREFNTDKDVYGIPFNVGFIIRVENLGNVHVKPHGTISVKNIFGKEVAVIRVNDRGSNVLPNSIRRFEASWSGKYGLGRYKASVGLSYGTSASQGGQGKQTLFTEKYFWIIPWRIIIPGLLGLIFMISLFMLMLRLYRNKAIKKAMEQAGMRNVRYVKKYQGPSPTLHLALILLVVFIILFLITGGIYLIFFA